MTVSAIYMKAQNAHIISVPPRYAAASLHSGLITVDGTQPEVALMAAGLRFLTPLDICALRGLLDHAAEKAAAVHLECPADDGVHRYLERMDVYADLPANVVLSRQRLSVRRSALGERLIELVRIRSCDDVEALMDRVDEIASGQVGNRPLAKAFATAIGAAAENAVMHADSPSGALVAAQRYNNRGLELAVVDRGRGIPATLSQNPAHHHHTDLEAVEGSLDDGVSSSTEAGRGAGLWELREALAASGNATLAIASGYADLSLSWTKGTAARNPSVPAQPISGTWISIRLED
jgi:anti-sigma regulatory factor (Ser/Thr protein kinase)